jgi:hypothetical protein
VKDDAALDDFQAALTALFARRLPPAEVARILAEDPAFAAHRDYVRAFTPALIDTAGYLASYWTRAD